jgi:hypothetical protein
VDPNDLVFKELQQLGLRLATDSLGGKVWTRPRRRRRAQLVSDYSGGSVLSECSQELRLERNGLFRLRERLFTAITGGGVSLPSETIKTIEGVWEADVGATELTMWLVLKYNDGDLFARWRLGEREPFTRCLDGDIWDVAPLP